MSNKTSMFVPVGKNIFDLNSITNIQYSNDNILVYVINNPNGITLTNEEYSQLLHYFFSNNNMSINMIPKYILVGNNMFVTNTITHVLYNDGNSLVFIINNQTDMPITEDEYDLLIKYLLTQFDNVVVESL